MIKHYQFREIPYTLCSWEERELARIKREDRLPEYYTGKTTLTITDKEGLNCEGELLVPTIILDRVVLLPESWIGEYITYRILGQICIDSFTPAHHPDFCWLFLESKRGIGRLQ